MEGIVVDSSAAWDYILAAVPSGALGDIQAVTVRLGRTLGCRGGPGRDRECGGRFRTLQWPVGRQQPTAQHESHTRPDLMARALQLWPPFMTKIWAKIGTSGYSRAHLVHSKQYVLSETPACSKVRTRVHPTR